MNNTKTERDATKERILNAAIECINEAGLAGVTVRAITERAGANPAAISYYYGGKEALIEAALVRSLDNAFDPADLMAPADLGPHERLVTVLDEFVAGALRYAGLSRAHLYGPLVQGDYDSPVVARLNAFLLELADDLRARYRDPPPDAGVLRAALVAAFAASFLFAATTPALFREAGGPDLGDAGERRKYLEATVARLLP